MRARIVELGVVALMAGTACGGGDEASATTPPPDATVDAAGSGGAGGGATIDAGVDAGGSDAGVDAAPPLGPPYPIVLAHGFFGFEEFAGVGFATYFYQVKDTLAKSGEVEVYTPAVDPFNDSTYRGAQLLAHVQAILATTGHAKVNLVGHSQGGLDARVVAHLRPDLVASVTTIATPHQGTPIADVVLKLVPSSQAQSLIDWLVKAVGQALYDQAGQQTALSKPMKLFSKQGIAEFNAKYTDGAGVSYFSIAGRSDWHLATAHCQALTPPSFIAKWQWETDPIEPLFAIAEAYLDGGIGNPYPNDGLVRVQDAKWGTFLGCIPADHLDEIGHLFGDSPGLGNAWRHDDFYVALAAFLREKGF